MRFKIEGMCCTEEADVLRRKIGKLTGNQDLVVIDILAKTMDVLPQDGRSLNPQQIIAAVGEEGMKARLLLPSSKASSSGTKTTFVVQGMDCMEEVAVLRQELQGVVGGVEKLSFDIVNQTMSVTLPTQGLTPADIMAHIRRIGMKASLATTEDQAEQVASAHDVKTLLTIACGVFMLVAIVIHSLQAGWLEALGWHADDGNAAPVPMSARLFYLLSIVAGAWYIAPKAWHAIRRWRPDMNLLMMMAVAGAVGIGQWLEAATVTLLFSLSLALEAWSMGRARRAINALMELTPTRATVLHDDGRESVVNPEQVPPGTRVIVKPGERMPLDGEVVQGESAVNQAPITGESLPVAKGLGAQVFAGTINGDGSLLIKTSKTAQDSTLAHIARLVKEAQGKRAAAEQWVETFARYYTPTVLLAAILVFLLPPMFTGASWQEWFYRSLVLLVIGCPCALVISTPVSILAALTAAAKNGLLVKGGMYIEEPAKLKVIAFDKTGTLTTGQPSIAALVPLNGHSEKELLERAYALEAQSTHPLATAVVAYAKSQGVTPLPMQDYQNLPGRGATGVIADERYWVGSHRYLEERGQETEDVHRELERLSRDGHSVVVIGNDKHVCGFLTLTDQARPQAAELIRDLKANGIAHVAMLTGDNKGTAEMIGKTLGLDQVYAELLPEDKIKIVEDLVTRYGHVAMVGDGVNDAPALARASVGIAMGSAGSDAAIETADIALMADDLSKIPWLIRHSRRTLSIIRQNIAFSLVVKLLFVLLTFAGHASLWAAIAADMGASFLVIFNGLRLLTSTRRS